MKSRLPLIIGFGLIAASIALPANSASSPPRTNWAHVNDAYIRYDLSGKGTSTVVLLHESGMTLESWDYVVPALTRNHRVLRYDLRGFGLSSAVRGAFTLEDELNDLRELLKSLNIRNKVILVGGAAGGAIALKFAASYPELVQQVIAITPAAYLNGQTQPQMSSPQGAAAGASPSAAGPAPSGGPNMDAAYPPAMRNADPARYEHFRAIQAVSDKGGQSLIGLLYAVKFAEVLPAIQCPTVIAATSQWIRPAAAYKELADAIPNARFEVLDTGHFAPMASPDLVTALLKKYLK